ncbi:MAG: hypothetical protein IIA33_03015, partial [Planctomycetes bacterium]|nr:hypothetical protein [Planctomycetota bacterium]
MRCECPLRNLVCGCALALALLPVLAVGGCGPIPFDAGFQPSADENILGTLVDDRGSFTFNLNPDTGNIQSIDADNGTITPPTDGQDFSVDRVDGGSLTVSPQDASDVLVAIRDDPTIGEDIVLTVARETLAGLDFRSIRFLYFRTVDDWVPFPLSLSALIFPLWKIHDRDITIAVHDHKIAGLIGNRVDID